MVRFGAVALNGFVILVAAALASLLTGWGPWHLVLPAALIVVAVLARVVPQPGVALVSAVASVGGAAAIAMNARALLHVPLLRTRTPWLDEGTGDLLVATAALFAAVMGTAAACAVGLRIARRTGGRAPLVWAGVETIVASVVLALVVVGGVHALRRPAPARYVASLPEVPVSVERTEAGKTRATFEGGHWAGWGCDPTAYDDSALAPPLGTVRERELLPSPDSPPQHPGAPPPAPARLVVQRDAARGIAVVSCASSPGDPLVEVSHLPDRDVPPTALAGSVAPPWTWIASAVAGLVAASLFGARGFRDVRARRAWTSARRAVHQGGGQVELEDGERLFIEAAARLRAGPVLVRFDDAPRAGARASDYRGGPAATGAHVVVGTAAELDAWLADRAAGAFAVAAAVAMTAAVPLAVAAIDGLL